MSVDSKLGKIRLISYEKRELPQFSTTTTKLNARGVTQKKLKNIVYPLLNSEENGEMRR
jgi:hypothetical protein